MVEKEKGLPGPPGIEGEAKKEYGKNIRFEIFYLRHGEKAGEELSPPPELKYLY